MSSAHRREHWQGVFRTRADDEVSWYQPTPTPSLELIARCNLPADAGIIDVGGGSSRLVDALLDQGFSNLTVLDISSQALDRARQRLGARGNRVRWIEADVTQWQPDRTYDLWHDRAAFHFLTDPADRAAYRQALLSATAPGAHVVIATFALDGPEKCSGLPVQRYDPAGLARELTDGFTALDSIVHAHTTPSGSQQQFQFSLLQRD